MKGFGGRGLGEACLGGLRGGVLCGENWFELWIGYLG